MTDIHSIDDTPKTSVLADGTVISRAYGDDGLESKRVEAINRIGTRWILHPNNKVQRGGVFSFPKVDGTSFFLTRYFDRLKLQAA